MTFLTRWNSTFCFDVGDWITAPTGLCKRVIVSSGGPRRGGAVPKGRGLTEINDHSTEKRIDFKLLFTVQPRNPDKQDYSQ